MNKLKKERICTDGGGIVLPADALLGWSSCLRNLRNSLTKQFQHQLLQISTDNVRVTLKFRKHLCSLVTWQLYRKNDPVKIPSREVFNITCQIKNITYRRWSNISDTLCIFGCNRIRIFFTKTHALSVQQRVKFKLKKLKLNLNEVRAHSNFVKVCFSINYFIVGRNLDS